MIRQSIGNILFHLPYKVERQWLAEIACNLLGVHPYKDGRPMLATDLIKKIEEYHPNIREVHLGHNFRSGEDWWIKKIVAKKEEELSMVEKSQMS